MEQNIKKIGLVDLIISLVISGSAAFLAFYSNTLSGQAAIVFLGLGFLVSAISYFQARLEDSERLEKLEFEELNKSKGSASLFNITDAEIFPAQRAREQFERVFVPAFTVLLFLLQSGAAYWLWTWLDKAIAKPLTRPMVAMSLYAMFALVLFLLGKYSASLARFRGESARLLRPGASYLLLGSYICFVVTGSLAAVQLGFPFVDRYVARALAVIVALAGLESLVTLVLEIYRPRVKGKAARVLYESRLVGLLAQPEGLVTTAAQALDYQFGFKVSETWFYRFLERALAWLILLQLGLLWLFTAVVFISPGEQALIERFGRPLANKPVLEPGLHFKLPWPIDTVYRERTREIQTFNIGLPPEPHDEAETAIETVLWTVSHNKEGQEEFNLLVASRESGAGPQAGGDRGAPVDLLTVSIPVQYQIKDLLAWKTNHVDAGKLLEKIATREVVRYLVGVDLKNVMSSGRSKAASDLARLIQARADELKLGVNIVFVGLQDIHPPVKVARKFEEVTGASQEAESLVRQAEAYAAQTVALAEANALKEVLDAQAYSNRVVSARQASAAQFANQILAYNAAPEIFMNRAYLQILERGSTNARKYVIAVTNSQDVIQLNLEDKVRPDLLDVPLPSSSR